MKSDYIEEKVIDVINSLKDYATQLRDIRPETLTMVCDTWFEKLESIKDNFQGDTKIVFIGEFSSGKSTFANALLGENILPTAKSPCTSVITEVELVSDGQGHRGKIFYIDQKPPDDMPSFEDIKQIIDGRTGVVGKYARIHHILLIYDIISLHNQNDIDLSLLGMLEKSKIKLIDCPGFNSPYGVNEEVIEDYVANSEYTFWFFPADRIGGSILKKIINRLKRKTSRIFPIITKSDLIPEEEREGIKERFLDDYGDIFKNIMEPKLVSPLIYFESVKLRKELDSKKIDDSTLQDKIHKLEQESGIENIAFEIAKRAEKKNMDKKKMEDVLVDINNITLAILEKSKAETAYLDKKLKEMGWKDNENTKLKRLKSEIDNMAKICAKEIANSFEEQVIQKLSPILMKKRKPISSLEHEIAVELKKMEKDIIEQKLRDYLDSISKKLKDEIELEMPDIKLQAPQVDLLKEQIKGSVLSIFDAISDVGTEAALKGGIGATLLISLSSIGSIKIIGGALAAVGGVVGIALVGLAILPIIPTYLDAKKDRDEKLLREFRDGIREWSRSIKIENQMLQKMNDGNVHLFQQLEIKEDMELSPMISKRDRADKISKELSEINFNLKQEFSHVNKI